MRIYPTLLLIFVLTALYCGRNLTIYIRHDFKKHYDAYKVEGSFALYDQSKNLFILFNEKQFHQPFTPASTFKICNSLIGLETGVIPDENFIIPWDSVSRNPVWDADHDLKTAFRNSTVWYYQELARRVGGDRMKFWLDHAQYGNKDMTGGIDRFWLQGGLRISPQQQIDFLRRLHDNELPFSRRSMDIVKQIMAEADSAGYILRGKTGWGGQSETDVGWYVGYVETEDNTWYFANCIQSSAESNNEIEQAIRFDKARRGITYRILHDLGFLPQTMP